MFKRLALKGSTITKSTHTKWTCLGKRIGLLILSTLAACGLNAPLHAQATSASISGHVSDPRNAAVPGATIQMTNLDTQIMTHAKTGATGLYVFPSLSPGNYQVNVSKRVFETHGHRVPRADAAFADDEGMPQALQKKDVWFNGNGMK